MSVQLHVVETVSQYTSSSVDYELWIDHDRQVDPAIPFGSICFAQYKGMSNGMLTPHDCNKELVYVLLFNLLV